MPPLETWLGEQGAAGLGLFALRFALDLVAVVTLVHGIYVRRHGTSELVFTYTMLNILTFLLCSLLQHAAFSVGLGFGLFAVFGILRYRTEALRPRDLTYLFVTIGLGMLNGALAESGGAVLVVVANVAILTASALLERRVHTNATMSLWYDRIDLLKPDRRAELIADLEGRLGVSVTRIDVGRIDMVRDAAELTVHPGAKPAALGAP